MVRRYPSSSLSEQRTLLLLSFGLIVVIVAALLVDALIPLYGFRPLITGGFSSLVIVNLFGFALSKTQLMTPAAEIVAERVLHATDDLVCVIGQDGYLSYATDVFRKALHLNQGEQLGRIHLRELVEEADRVLENASNAMHGPVSLEVHFKTRTGSVFPAALSVSQLLDRTKPTGLVLVGRDISEPRELARKYEESQEKYQNIVESSLDGIVVIQEEALVFVNPSAIRIFGYESAHEMMRTRFNDIVAPASKPFLLGDYQAKKIGEDLFRNYEMTGLTKSGNFIDLEINAKLVTWNGKMAVQASFRDITERKHLERDQVLWFWEQESLRAIDKQLAASFELDRVLNTVSRNARAFSGADFSGVILIQESKFYQWRGVKGNRSAVGSEQYLMKGSHRDLMASGQPRVIRSFGVDPGFPATDFPVLTAEGLTTVALFPFGIKENLEGVLVVGFRKTRNLSEPEHRLLSSLADKAAIAIANAALYEDLLEREKELEQLTDARMEAEEAERRRIARELHDGLGQMLSAIKFNIEVLEDTEGLKEVDLKKLLEVKQLLDSVMTEAREISHNLMPSVLEDFGLKPALQLLCESFAKRLEIPISFQVHGVEGRLGNALEVNIYRIAQEGLNNISKHAHAKSVSVQLHFDEGGLRLTIEDEGEGFTTPLPKAPAEKGGMGLINMKHRASTFGGSLTVESHPGKGTTIIVQIPHAQEQQQ
jgi:PAS domain S-box-containing protein